MTHNIGETDRIIRIAVGLLLVTVAIFRPGGSYNWIGLIGVMPLLTALSGWCRPIQCSAPIVAGGLSSADNYLAACRTDVCR